MMNRKALESNLQDIVSSNNANKILMQNVRNMASEKGMSLGVFTDYWQMNIPYENMTEVQLFIFTKALFNATANNRIDPAKYFTAVELRDGENAIINNEEKSMAYPLHFDNSLKISDDHFITRLSAKNIKMMYDSKLIIYNYDTQRNPKLQVDDGILSKVINLNRASVNAIKNSILNNEFISNCITLNVLADGTDHVTYNNGTLSIAAGQINIIDGYHRIMGMIGAIAENPNCDFITEVRFTNWNVPKSRNFIFQEDKRNKIDKRYLDGIININKLGNKVATRLNEGTSDVKGKITTDINMIKSGRALTFMSMVADSAEFVYELKTNYDVTKTAEWIGEFYDTIIGLNYEIFSNITNKNDREKNVITYPAMFSFMIMLSKYLKDTEKWDFKIKEILSSLNFSIENPLWTELRVAKNGKMNLQLKQADYRRMNEYIMQNIIQAEGLS